MSGNLVAGKTGPGTAVSTGHEVDNFDAYSATSAGVTGNFLSFNRNEYLYGQNKDVLAMGTRLVAFMPGLKMGWRRWWEAKVTADLMELLSDKMPHQHPPRSELGDMDSGMWERDAAGQARDPWQWTNILDMADGNGERYIYSTTSAGGINAIKRLNTAYVELRKQHPGLLPMIELKSSHYMHQQWGKLYVPEFPIVGWAHPETLEPEGDIPPEDEPIPFDVEKPAPAPMAAARTAAKAAAAPVNKAPKF